MWIWCCTPSLLRESNKVKCLTEKVASSTPSTSASAMPLQSQCCTQVPSLRSHHRDDLTKTTLHPPLCSNGDKNERVQHITTAPVVHMHHLAIHNYRWPREYDGFVQRCFCCGRCKTFDETMAAQSSPTATLGSRSQALCQSQPVARSNQYGKSRCHEKSLARRCPRLGVQHAHSPTHTHTPLLRTGQEIKQLQ